MTVNIGLPPPAGRTQVSSRDLRRIISASVADTSLAQPALTTTKPTAGIIAIEHCPFVRLLFGGTDAADETVNYQVIAWRVLVLDPLAPVWIGEVIASGAFTLGTLALSTLIEAANGLVADTVTNTPNISGTVARSPADNTIASLLLPTVGATLLQVQTERGTTGTAAKADVFVQLCEN
jgi:hypothetical protein